MRLMRDLVRGRNVYRWAGQMLIDASQLRKRHRILDLAENGVFNAAGLGLVRRRA